MDSNNQSNVEEFFLPQQISSFNHEGIALARDSNGYFHIDSNGKDLYLDRFDYCTNFIDGLAVAKHNSKYFHISLSGDKAYSSTFDFAADFNEGFAVVKELGSSWYTHIDRKGKHLHGNKYLELDNFYEGYARAKDHMGWFHINKKGKPAYSKRYMSINNMLNSTACVTDQHEGTYLIDEQGNILDTIIEPKTNAYEAVSGTIVSYWKTQVIKAAVDIKIFDYLPATAIELSGKLKINEDLIVRLLRALLEINFASKDNDIYSTNEFSQYLRTSHSESLVPAVHHWSMENYYAWAGLTDAIQSGEASYKKAYNLPIFEWLEKDKQILQQYHELMSTYAIQDYPNLIDKLDLSDAKTVIDAAGGKGIIISKILSNYPEIKGILLERPKVIEMIDIDPKLKKRAKILPFDLFQPWDVEGEVIILARVLHDWNNEKCKIILKHAKNALRKSGKIIVIERLLDENNADGGLLDLNMLVITGGKERTLKDLQSLFNEFDFTYKKIITHRHHHAIEFEKY